MASLYVVWIPTLIVAHALGLLLLLYSLEQVGGHVSKFFGWLCGCGRPKASSDEATEEEDAADKAKKGTEMVAISVTAAASPAADLLPAPFSAELAWKDVGCSVLDSKTLAQRTVLTGCTGVARSGETVGLMGPSGAGKTTLLDVLAGRRSGGNVAGGVTLNGKPCGPHFRRISAYVPQEDSFVATLTALETLRFRAALTLPAGTSPAARRERIRAVLETMGLWRVRDTKVGGLLPGGIEVRGLSGGEKRRLSIACSLIASPSVLFLDEPTTGLDSFAALNVMDHLSALARMGHTVIASIHQPRPAIFARFHAVAILSEGHCLYQGPPTQVVDWFSSALGYHYDVKEAGNVPDWLMDTVSIGFAKPREAAARSMTTVAEVRAAAQAFRERATAAALPAADAQTAAAADAQTPSGDYAASWFKQFRVLFKRAMLSQIRNPTDTSSRLLMSTWVGTLAGLVFISQPEGAASTQQRMALLFFVLLLYQLMPFCFMSFYVADRRFFQADVAADLYAPSAYYLAAVSASAPFVILNTVAGGLMAYGLTGLRFTGEAIILYVVVLCLQALVSNQLQIFCVWLTPNQDMAYVLATGYVASSILLSGFYLRISQIKVGFIRGLSWLSYTRYAMQGAGRIELAGVAWDPATCQSTPAGPATGAPVTTCQTTGDDLLDFYGYSMAVSTVVLAMLGFFLVFHAGSYLSLSRLYRRR